MDFFSSLYIFRAAMDSAETKQSAQRAATKAFQAAQAVGDLQDRLDRLVLSCHAMWSLLREKLDLSEEDLLQRMVQIDLSDGVQDGKVRKRPAECPSCGRKMSMRHRRCLYCGQSNQAAGSFDTAL